jgi:hypothetical protein
LGFEAALLGQTRKAAFGPLFFMLDLYAASDRRTSKDHLADDVVLMHMIWSLMNMAHLPAFNGTQSTRLRKRIKQSNMMPSNIGERNRSR